MKRGLLILCTAFIALSAPESALAANVSYVRTVWNHTSANVVQVNMDSPNIRVTPALAKHGAGSSEGFKSMVNRLHPIAAITGTFFCTRSLQPTGDIVIEGKPMHLGCVGTGLCIMDDGRVEFKSLKDGRASGWQGCRTVICGGPTLVRHGRVTLAPRSEGFRDPGFFRQKRRSAVGLTKSNKLLMVTVDKPIYLSDLAKLLIHLGAVDAVDLDGGSSTALYYRGKIVSRPERRLTNLLVVYESPSQYAAYRSELAPKMPQIAIAAEPAAVLGDGILSDLFGKAPKLTPADALRRYSHPLPDPQNGLQVISSKPSSLD